MPKTHTPLALELLENRRLLTGEGTLVPLASIQPVGQQDLLPNQNVNAQQALIADLDQDGELDYVLATNASRLEIQFMASSDGFADTHKLSIPGTYVEDMAKGDINGDGFVDIVVAASKSVVSYLNLGISEDGSWLGMTREQQITGTSGTVELSDLNGDGNDDLAMANENGIEVRFADSDGTFESGVTYLEGPGHKALATGDVNNDGHQDIVASVSDSETAVLLLNDGDGFFEAGQSLADVESNRMMKLMDVNADGQLDLVAGAFGHFEFTTGPTLFIWQADSDGQFAEHPVGFETIGSPLDFEMGDINGDGIEDMLVGHTSTFHHPTNGNGPGGVSVMIATAAGQFSDPVRISTPGGMQVAVEETTTGPELVAVRSWSGYVSRYKWNPEPAIQSAYDYGEGQTSQFQRKDAAFGDFNGDGRLDAITVDLSATPSVLEVYHSNDEGNYDVSPLAFARNSRVIQVFTGDFNGDGRDDIGLGTDAEIGSFLSNADGTMGEFVRSTSLRQTFANPTVVDVDGDGDDDLVGLEASGQTTWIVTALADSDGTWTRQTDRVRLTSPWVSQVRVDDLNMDGNLDFLTTSGDTVEVALGDGEAFAAPIQLKLPTSATAVGDLNGDGFKDIVGFGFQFGAGEPRFRHEVAYGRADGFDLPKTIEIDEQITSVDAIQVADIDLDGIDEIAVFRQEELYVLNADTDDNFSTAFQSNLGFYASDVVVRDVTGDDIPDLTVSPAINFIYGSAAMTMAVLPGTATGEYQPASMSTASFVDGSVTRIAQHDGGVEFFVRHRFGFGKFVAEFPSTPIVGDFDGSGSIDAGDIDLLCLASHNESLPDQEVSRFDQNGDELVNSLDADAWLTEIAQTNPGDTDIDGDVDFADFLKLSANFGATDALWSDGDFNCDGEISFADFLLLSTNFGAN